MTLSPEDEAVETAVKSILVRREIRTTRVFSVAGGGIVETSDLLDAVQRRLGDQPDLVEHVDRAVTRIGGIKRKMFTIRPLLKSQQAAQTQPKGEVYVFPMRILPPPYDDPF